MVLQEAAAHPGHTASRDRVAPSGIMASEAQKDPWAAAEDRDQKDLRAQLVQLGNRGRMLLEDLGDLAVLVPQGNQSLGHGATADRVVQEERLEKASQGLQARLPTRAQEDARDAQVP